MVFTDFQGLGVLGGSIHPFLQGETEARGALDIMRVARQVDPNIGTRYIVMGHSEGGQADCSRLGSDAFLPPRGRSLPPHIAAPTFIMQGGADVTVSPAATDAVARTLCANGNQVLYRTFPSADHESIVLRGNDDAVARVKARFRNLPAATNCGSVPTAQPQDVRR